MLHDGFAASERTGDCRNAALCNREKRVDDSLSRDERSFRRKFFTVRSALSDGPLLKHGDVDVALFRFDDANCFVNGKVALLDFLDDAFYAVRSHDFVQNKDVFLHDAEHAAALDAVAHGNFRLKSPLLFMVYCGKIHASFDTIARHFFEFCKRSLNTVVYALDKTGGKLDGKGRARRIYVFAGAESARFFINLYGRAVAAKFYNFTDEFLFAYVNHVVHFALGHALCNNQRSGYLYDFSSFHFRPLICSLCRIICLRLSPFPRWLLCLQAPRPCCPLPTVSAR